MTAIDTNILIDLIVTSMPSHVVTTQGMGRLNDKFCTTATNVGECLRLLTHPKVFPKPLSASAAVSTMGELFEYYQIEVLEEDVAWWREIPEMETEVPGLKGNEIFDARIAICLRSHNVKRIYTRDSDFKKYSFLRVIHPL